MGKNQESRLPKYYVLVISLCLCSLALCVLADPVVIWDDHHHRSELGGIPDSSHFDEHEDDFVLNGSAAASAQAAATLAKISTHLPEASHSPSPLLPPPKAG